LGGNQDEEPKDKRGSPSPHLAREISYRRSCDDESEGVGKEGVGDERGEAVVGVSEGGESEREDRNDNRVGGEVDGFWKGEYSERSVRSESFS